jgi:alcohol dehydrogenase class IV
VDKINKISFSNPSRLVFGIGSLADFVTDFKQLEKKRLFLLTIPVILKQISSSLSEIEETGVSILINKEIEGEPSFADFDKILLEAKNFKADSVVAIGGGSVMDVAKMLAAMLGINHNVRDFIGIGLLPKRNTYLACLPTTSGTGSEVSPNAIFLDEIDGGKKGVISPFLVPDAAYIDPILSIGVPASVTAATGIDAFTHCMEAYVNNFSHPMVDVYALEGMRLIASGLTKAVKNGNDLDARTEVALGSLYGGMCLGPVNTGAIHALSYPLGSNFKIPHGLSNALLMPYVVAFNLPAAYSKYAKVALTLGAEQKSNDEETALEGVAIMKKWVLDCGLPTKLSEINIPESKIEPMATDAIKIQRLLKNNVREVSWADAVEIYKKAY